MPRIEIPAGEGTETMRALAHQPEMIEVFRSHGRVVRESELDPRVHELVRMRVAEINGCMHCMAWREKFGVQAGVTDDLLSRVSAYAGDPAFSPSERVAIEYAERFCVEPAAIDDELFDRMHEHFSDAEIVMLTTAIAKYLAWGRVLAVLDLDQACAIGPIATEPALPASGLSV